MGLSVILKIKWEASLAPSHRCPGTTWIQNNLEDASRFCLWLRRVWDFLVHVQGYTSTTVVAVAPLPNLNLLRGERGNGAPRAQPLGHDQTSRVDSCGSTTRETKNPSWNAVAWKILRSSCRERAVGIVPYVAFDKALAHPSSFFQVHIHHKQEVPKR